MTYGTIEQVAQELGRLPDSVTPEEVLQWGQWLERVERTIRARFTRAGLVLSTQVALDAPDAETVADVEVAAVARKIENPSGDTSTTVTIDDGSVTRRKEGASTAPGLELTDAEWALLLPASTAGAYSTRPSFVPDTCFEVLP